MLNLVLFLPTLDSLRPRCLFTIEIKMTRFRRLKGTWLTPTLEGPPSPGDSYNDALHGPVQDYPSVPRPDNAHGLTAVVIPVIKNKTMRDIDNPGNASRWWHSWGCSLVPKFQLSLREAQGIPVLFRIQCSVCVLTRFEIFPG